MNILTIVIPFYNIEYFENTITSLSLQKDKRFNVFIGNDNSPNNPEKVINQNKNNLNITYKVFKNNLGHTDLTKHWARCIDEIDTEWFLILGDDDKLEDIAVEEFYKSLDSEKHNVFRFKTQIIDAEGKSIGEINDYSNISNAADFQVLNSKYKVRSSLGEYVFRKSQYEKYGIRNYKKAFYSDNWLFLNYSEFGYISSVNALVYIRITDTSLSGNKNYRNDVAEASYLFHFDIMQNHASYFTMKDKQVFLPYLITGYIKDLLIVDKKTFYKIIFFNYNFFCFLIAFIKIFKNKKSL